MFIADLRLPICDWRLRIADCELRIANCELRMSDLRLTIDGCLCNLQSLISNPPALYHIFVVYVNILNTEWLLCR